MKIKESRIGSFIIIAAVYILATVIGSIAYVYMPFAFWLNLLLADILATVVVFICSVIFKNASVYDPYWSVQPIVILIGYAVGKTLTLTGWLLLIAVCLWGVRLTVNWAYTFPNLTHQDWRYTMLDEKTGKLYPIINFVGIHLVPTLVVYACVLPAVYVLYFTAQFHPLCLIFTAVSLGATILQGVSDIQMHKFRKNKRAGKVSGFIREGLWKYSRHPNYLGEILMWWGVGLVSICAMPSRWYLLLGALANTLLFFCVSIPMADRRQSCKEGFADYKAHTRMLLPIKKVKGEEWDVQLVQS